MKHGKLTAMLGCLLLAASAAAIGTTAQKTQNAQKPSVTSQEMKGQKVFEQNCSRCHATPTAIPARITGTVAKHMRVIARLSDSDYKALLEFLKP